MWQPTKRYVLCSQGFPIDETDDREEAIDKALKSNDKWYDYKQKCLDEGEPYADNKVDVYDQVEDVDINLWDEMKKRHKPRRKEAERDV